MAIYSKILVVVLFLGFASQRQTVTFQDLSKGLVSSGVTSDRWIVGQHLLVS